MHKHDRVKEAARRRQAETGEPYMVARRKVIEERERMQEEADDAPGPGDES